MTAREMKRAGVLFLIAALAFLYPLLKGNAHFVGDITYSFQPWLTYAAQEIQAGRFPLWNPYSACGELFVGNPQIMLFNPTAALFWIFPFTAANGLFLFLSQALLFFFTYLLARRWAGRRNPGQAHLHGPAALAALAFAWGGFAVSQWEFPSAVGTLPFLPLLFLLGLGEFWVALSVGVALAFTAGYVQFVHYGVFLAVAGAAQTAITRRPFHRWTARWSPLMWVSVALGGGILLSLAQILPSWEMARQSFRAALETAEARHFSLTPIFLLKLWVPWITNTTALVFQQVPFGPEFWPIQRSWLSTLFLGTGVCLLSIVGILRTPLRKTLTLGTVTLAAGILAFGVEPFFGWARALVPGFRYLTHFANASVLGLLCLTLWCTEGAHQRRGRNALLALVTLGLLGVSLGLTFFTGIRALALRWLLGLAALTPAQDRWAMEAGAISAAAALCFAGIWLFFRRKRWAALWCFTLLELATLGRTLQPTGPATLFHDVLPLAREMAVSPHRFGVSPSTMKGDKLLAGTNLVEGYRSGRAALYPGVPLPFRAHQTWGYEVFGLRAFTEFRRGVPDRPGESPALDFLGASRIMSTVALPPPSQLIARRENALLYARPRALERLTMVPAAVVRADSADRLNYLVGPWNPEKEVVLEEATGEAAGRGVLEHWREGPGRVEAEGQGTGWLVYSGVFFPGWEAFVNGQPTRIQRANHAFQTLRTPEGPWTAKLLFRPKLFRTGLWVTILSVLTLAVWMGRRAARGFASLP